MINHVEQVEWLWLTSENKWCKYGEPFRTSGVIMIKHWEQTVLVWLTIENR